jgi:hypothetical protein
MEGMFTDKKYRKKRKNMYLGYSQTPRLEPATPGYCNESII